jgi:hypothetical protein
MRPPNPFEVQEPAWLGQFSGGGIVGELVPRTLPENALGDDVSEYRVESVLVAARRHGQVVDLFVPGFDVLGDPQRGRHVQAPRRPQVEEVVQVNLGLFVSAPG